MKGSLVAMRVTRRMEARPTDLSSSMSQGTKGLEESIVTKKQSYKICYKTKIVRPILLAIVSFVIVLMTSCLHHQGSESTVVQTLSVVPESVGLRSSKLGDLIEYVIKTDTNIHSVVIMRNGGWTLDGCHLHGARGTQRARDRITTRLKENHFGLLNPGVYIRAQELSAAEIGFVEQERIGEYVTVFRGRLRFDDPAPVPAESGYFCPDELSVDCG